jgi:cold shock protein
MPLLLPRGIFIATKPEREGGLQHMTRGASKARGTVRWFSNEGDHGFVCPDDGGQDIHVRREHIVGDGAELLEKGDRVTYDMSEDAKGLWARHVSREEKQVPDEEAIKEWRATARALRDLLPLAENIGLGFLIAATDATERVEMALERAEARIREASG